MHYTLIVDLREAVLKKSDDVILSKARTFAGAREIFAGSKMPGSRSTSRTGHSRCLECPLGAAEADIPGRSAFDPSGHADPSE